VARNLVQELGAWATGPDGGVRYGTFLPSAISGRLNDEEGLALARLVVRDVDAQVRLAVRALKEMDARSLDSVRTSVRRSALINRRLAVGHVEDPAAPARRDGSVPSAPRVAPGGRHLVAPPLGWWRAIGRPHRHQRK